MYLIMNLAKQAAQSLFPKSVRRTILRQTRWPRVGQVDFGHFRSLKPISRDWGGDRGKSIDRLYIEQFLANHTDDIRGIVLEVGDNAYTRHFGQAKVTTSEIVHGSPGNPIADYVADFANAPHLPSDRFDCIICTQTLQLIADLDASIQTLYRILAPGGTLLLTVPGISKIYADDRQQWTDHWRFTDAAARWSFGKIFEPSKVQVETYGNVLVATAFLQGLAVEDLSEEELTFNDSRYQMVVSVCARK